MNAVVIIFMIVATIFALGTLAYVATDIILEIRAKRAEADKAENNADEDISESAPESADSVDAEEG